jgi:hypothetical protein
MHRGNYLNAFSCFVRRHRTRSAPRGNISKDSPNVSDEAVVGSMFLPPLKEPSGVAAASSGTDVSPNGLKRLLEQPWVGYIDGANRYQPC